MARSRTYYPNLSRALPADDPLAKLAARALVLYGDLLFEWPGIRDDDGFEGLAELGDFHRRLYFFRASTVTLRSCSCLLNSLMKERTFREMLDNDAAAGARFLNAKKQFDRHTQLVARVRNAVGGHMEQDIGEAVTRLDPDERAPIEIYGRGALRPHLASLILVHAIIENHPGDTAAQKEEAFRRILNDIHDATEAMLAALTEFLGMYGDRHPLFGS